MLSVSPDSVGEGATLSWTVTATTLMDQAPPADLALAVRVASEDIEGEAVAGEDYAAVDAARTFVGGDFEPKTVGGEQRYVAHKTGTVAITDDVLVENEERFALHASIESGGAGWTVETATAGGTIADNDLWSVAVTAEPSEIVEGETREVTLTATRLPEQGAGCGPWAVDVGLAVAGTVSEDDYTVTPAPGQQRLAICDENPMLQWKVSLATVLDAAEDDGETVTFHAGGHAGDAGRDPGPGQRAGRHRDHPRGARLVPSRNALSPRRAVRRATRWCWRRGRRGR